MSVEDKSIGNVVKFYESLDEYRDVFKISSGGTTMNLFSISESLDETIACFNSLVNTLSDAVDVERKRIEAEKEKEKERRRSQNQRIENVKGQNIFNNDKYLPY